MSKPSQHQRPASPVMGKGRKCAWGYTPVVIPCSRGRRGLAGVGRSRCGPFQNYYPRSLLLGKTFCIMSHQLGSFPPSLFLDASAVFYFPAGRDFLDAPAMYQGKITTYAVRLALGLLACARAAATNLTGHFGKSLDTILSRWQPPLPTCVLDHGNNGLTRILEIGCGTCTRSSNCCSPKCPRPATVSGLTLPCASHPALYDSYY